VLTGSGVDEAWTTGAQLAHAVVELARASQPFTRANLQNAYVARRRASWLEAESRIAEKSRDGFHRGVVSGMVGMALTGLTGGKYAVKGKPRPTATPEEFYAGKIPAAEVQRIVAECRAKGVSCHEPLMEACGWPAIPFDGQLLVTHQDALLVGGKVQAPAGFADHVHFLEPYLCEACRTKQCLEMCSGQAIAPGTDGVPAFDREKCVHCGACVWNCPNSAIAFLAGAGGLHSTEN